MKHFLLLLCIAFCLPWSANAQIIPCDVNITATYNGVVDCNGADVDLYAVGQGQYTLVMDNDFNSGNLGPGWVSTGGSSVGTACGSSLDGTSYYWASTSTGTPNLTTEAYDLSCGGVISFDMAYATQGGAAPCEGPDLADEGVTLQYSTDGGATWTVIQYWGPNGGYDPTMTTWNNYSIPIPPGASVPNVQFQWIQNNSSGTCCDNWGIDNVQILSIVNCVPYWYDWSQVAGSPDNQAQNVTPTTTTTYTVTYTNGTDMCQDQITIVIPPGVTADAGPDQVYCPGSGGVTVGGNPVSVEETATYSWDNGGSSGTIDLTGPVTDNGQGVVAPAVNTQYTVQVTYNGCTATDDMWVIVDQPPTASNPAPINVECAADIPATNVSVVTDEADDYTAVPTVAWLSDVSDNNTCPETITRTYRVSDACGSYVDVAQTITVQDVTNPILNPPPGPVTVECVGDVPAMTDLGWTDNCDGAGTVTGVDGPVVGGYCGGTVTRTWTYTDACGNSATATQTITINDTQAPTLDPAPADITVECPGDIPAMTDLNWIDNCDGAGTVTGVDSPIPANLCGGTVTRTWTYTDNCGNATTVTQTITINDTQAPTASNPPAQTGTPPAPDPTVVTDEADNCGAPVVAFVGDVSDGGICPETITRTYSVTDVCGNQILVTQTFTVGDAVFPTASNPATMYVQCSADVPAPDPLVVTDEADNSTIPVVTWESDVSDNNSCPETITRTYRVTDDCGNYIVVTQLIIVNDTQVPVFAAAPADVTVQCVGDVPAMTDLGWTDNCDGAGTVTGVDSPIPANLCGGTITRTWTYTDACGNVATATQTITINDTQAPVLDPAPADVTVQCVGDVPAMTDLNWTDNCDGAGTVTGVDSPIPANLCGGTITRTWTYTDNCGNAATATQTITINDTQDPVLDPAPADVTVECVGDIPAMTDLNWTDNCDGAGTVTGVDSPIPANLCGGTITRTWTYTDNCGNVATATQTITIDDTTPPTATNPATTTVPGGPAPAIDPTIVIDEADNCTANPVVAFVSESSDGNPCPETITRIYSVTDDCGNSINVTHLIVITDPILPTATAPANVNVECIGDVPAADPLIIIDEADNQGVPTVQWEGDVSDGNSCPETITRTYSVTDVCGNQILLDQLIIVNDVTLPTATNPVTVNVECIDDVPVPDVLVVTDEADNCTAQPVVAHVGDVSDGLSCPETITRTYSVTDDCGNQITVDQLIIINDVTAPTATAPPSVTVECIMDVPAANVNIITDEADNCTLSPLVVWEGDVSDGNNCPETITRTYSITDDCGNVTLVTQTIVVNDVTLPTASNPFPISVPGANDVPAPDPTVVIDEADNCTVEPVVAWVSDVSDGNVCNLETITRTYSVTDDCGNQIFVTQEITILATYPPIDAGADALICEGETITLTAGNPWNVPISWNPSNPPVDGVPFSPTQTDTYTVTADNLGCISTDDVTITVEPLPVVNFMGDTLSGCAPLTVVFTNNTVSSSALTDCIWEINGETLNGCNTVSYTFTEGGTYDVSLTSTTVNGCSSSMTYTDYIYVEDLPIASFTASPTQVSTIDTEVEFTNTSEGATNYSWDFGYETVNSTEEHPTHTFPDAETAGYTVELVAYTPLGCSDTAWLVITVQEELIYYVPNTFTPDGDSYNEFFRPIFTSGFDPFDFSLFIYNRWGEIIWESHDASVGWDGTYGGKIVPDGTYTWKIEFKTSATDERVLKTGHVNVLK